MSGEPETAGPCIGVRLEGLSDELKKKTKSPRTNIKKKINKKTTTSKFKPKKIVDPNSPFAVLEKLL